MDEVNKLKQSEAGPSSQPQVELNSASNVQSEKPEEMEALVWYAVPKRILTRLERLERVLTKMEDTVGTWQQSIRHMLRCARSVPFGKDPKTGEVKENCKLRCWRHCIPACDVTAHPGRHYDTDDDEEEGTRL